MSGRITISPVCHVTDPEYSPFLNWNPIDPVTADSVSPVFVSLVSMVRDDFKFDHEQIIKASTLLSSMFLDPNRSFDINGLLKTFGQTSKDPAAVFVDSMAPTLCFVCSSHIPTIFQSLHTEVEHDDTNQFIHWFFSDTLNTWKAGGDETEQNGIVLLQRLEREGFRDKKMTGLDTNTSSSTESPCSDCYPFLNWRPGPRESEHIQAVVFRSLVATVKLQPSLDDSLEAKAVQFLKSVSPVTQSSAETFLNSIASSSDDSLTNFVLSMLLLISSPSQTIPTAAMRLLDNLIMKFSATVRLSLVKADLIPQLIIILNPQSFSPTETVDISVHLSIIIRNFLWLPTRAGLVYLGIEDDREQQAVHETVLKHVLVPSEKYICRLCVNRYSILDGNQSYEFMLLLTHLLELFHSYRPTMDFALHIPIILTLPSCLTFFEFDVSIYYFLYIMNNNQREWNETRGGARQMWNAVLSMLRMEGIYDVIDEMLQYDKHSYGGGVIVANSINWNNWQGVNLRQ
ncbi:hypothetical protein BLNAU_17721 [Blattamonas nauphoetae]|uniref:Uncharacterized protein n=1 Tax=Blattamonas nauphoetae TaxID=2049346 RepID=A0ABQ9X8Y5_9EUKA|nr:hypothetical protein BLNAU_17721 [Blattamonas nauphoetae]